MRRLCPLMLVMLTATAVSGGAAAPPLPRMTRLSDGVYFYEHVDPTKAGVTANNLVVVGADAVLVADGQGTPANTAELVAAIATLTPRPIRYVVVGSEHGDHRGGDSAFPATAAFIAHPSSQTALKSQASSSTRRAGAPPVVVPTETEDHARTIDLGGRSVVVRFLGRAHTGGDLEVLVPQARVAYMSESYISGIFPSLANGFPTEWAAMLKAAESLDVDTFVPAHGLMDASSVLTRAGVVAYRQAIEAVIAEGTRLHAAGVPAAEAVAQARFGALADLHRFKENVAGALGRVYAELEGTLPSPALRLVRGSDRYAAGRVRPLEAKALTRPA